MNHPAQRSRWLPFCCLLLLAVGVRAAVLGGGWQRLDRDPDSYRRLAETLVRHGTFGSLIEREGEWLILPTAYRPPLYPLLLAGIGLDGHVTSPRVAALHLVLGVGTVLMFYGFAARRFGTGVGIAAAALVAVDPILLNQSALVMTETLATFLAVLCWWCVSLAAERQRPWMAWAAGGALGLASLCRPTFLVWFGCLAVVLLVDALRHRRWNPWLGMCLAACLVLAPWGLRNLAVFGRPMVTSTHGGYTLWLGNNPGFYRFLSAVPRESVWDSAELDARHRLRKRELGYDEIAADRWARQQAMQSIRSQPGMFLYSSAVRVGWMWGLVPHRLSPRESAGHQAARYAVGGWYAAVFLAAAAGLAFLRRRLLQSPLVWGLLLCLSFTLVHCFYWSNLRMRAPLMPVVCLLAAVGMGGLYDAARQRMKWAGGVAAGAAGD